MGGPLADTPLLAALLSSISAIHSCQLVAPSPHSEDPQVRAGGWRITGTQRLPLLTSCGQLVTPPLGLSAA